MKVMVLVKASPESEAGELPTEELISAMTAYNEELVAAGIMLNGEGLKPSAEGARIRFSGNDRSVINGPFSHTEELVAGFWIWEVKSMNEAIEWAKRCPNPMSSDSDLEIRPFYELEDFGETLTPELRAREEHMRSTIKQ